MSNQIEFEEDTNFLTSRRIIGEAVVPGMAKFLVKSGIAKDERQSYYFLISIAVVGILISIFLVSYYVMGVGNPETVKYSIPPALQEQILINEANNQSVIEEQE